MSDTINIQNVTANSNKSYIAPEYERRAFHCSHCSVYANQYWLSIRQCNKKLIVEKMRICLKVQSRNILSIDNLIDRVLSDLSTIYDELYKIVDSRFAFCDHCKKYSIWVDKKMVYPHLSTAPLPVVEMPESVKELYNEARSISNQSPRGACALLRLAIQFLVKELKEDEKNLNKAIGNLVKKGLPEKIQRALDSVRVIGNNLVHPGVIDIKDNPEIASSLFMLVNFICEKMITEDRKVDAIYNALPLDKIKAINNRDNRVNCDKN